MGLEFARWFSDILVSSLTWSGALLEFLGKPTGNCGRFVKSVLKHFQKSKVLASITHSFCVLYWLQSGVLGHNLVKFKLLYP